MDGCCSQGCCAQVDFRLHNKIQVQDVPCQSDLSACLDIGDWTTHDKIVGPGCSLVDVQTCMDAVECKSFLCNSPPSRQPLQTEQTEYLDGARVHLDDVPFSNIQPQPAGKRFHVKRRRGAAPSDRARHVALSAPDNAGVPKMGQHRTQIAGLRPHVQRNKPSGQISRLQFAVFRRCMDAPCAASLQTAIGHARCQLMDAPDVACALRRCIVHQFCAGRTRLCTVAGAQYQTIELVASQINLGCVNIQKRQSLRVGCLSHIVANLLHIGWCNGQMV